MLQLFIIFCSLNAFSFSQSKPYFIPYSLINNEINLIDYPVNVEKNISLSFKENAKDYVLPTGVLYRLTLRFKSPQKGFLSIKNWNVPKGAMLFVFQNTQFYSGPFLSHDGQSFLSGKFNSDRLILEYFEPINSLFSGNFLINEIQQDFFENHDASDYKNILKIDSNRDRPKILVTGYWPPTNEMVRHFSKSEVLNPEGWQGENWENLGYDIVSYFPEFIPSNCNNCGQGYGDLEVDYQDYSQDFWPIVEDIRPVGIITFSRGFNDLSWELENRLVNRTNWYDDYIAPFLPTPNPPDDTEASYHVRYNSLPVPEIISAIEAARLGLDPYLDNTNAGLYLSEFSGYHGVWYKDSYDSDNEFPCYASGHIHVGSQIDWDTAKEAAEISIRSLIEYVDQFVVINGDSNGDGIVNILDIVLLSSAVLGNSELTDNQFLSSDIDSNGELNVLDIIAIINLILE